MIATDKYAMTNTGTLTHRWWVAALIILNVVLLLGVLFLSYISMSDLVAEDIFLSNQRNLSANYYIEINPATWAFTVWGVIYIWTFIWLVYAVTLICRKTPEGYLYVKPPVIPVAVYPIISVNLILNVAFLFLFDREMLIPSGIVLFGLAISLYICLTLLAIKCHSTAKFLLKHGHKVDLWCLRLFVNNGLAVYAGWCTLAKLLNLTIVLTYSFGVDMQIASTISLSILAGELCVFFIIENFVFEKEMRYTVAHYGAVIWGLTASFMKNYGNVLPRNGYMIAALLGAASFLFVVKFLRTLYMHFKWPLYQTDIEKMKLKENIA